MYLYDPRKDQFVQTDNPILIMADAIIRIGAIKPDKNFWEKITILADYHDTKYNKRKITNIVKKEFKKQKTKKFVPRRKRRKIIDLKEKTKKV